MSRSAGMQTREVRDGQPCDAYAECRAPRVPRNFNAKVVDISQAAVELVLDAHATIGKSPTWCAAQGLLFWIDVKAPALHRFDPEDGSDRQWALPSEIGCFALTAAGDRALLGLRSGLFDFDIASGRLTQLAGPPFDPKTHRFNEGGCDATGRFWLGTMFDPQPGVDVKPLPGSLHSFTPAEGLRTIPDVALIPNGMA